ncbi:aldo/keto reductase [Daejeonella sp. JGW-45]|uniref:aldo/keto reductase n=1 Tax=Daejeonella sp. JGW-45 TaxID=3034148 RepID=UPI0023EDDBDD|nr:aldo/keto reductase [Daejeonella sp. JGW-45]
MNDQIHMKEANMQNRDTKFYNIPFEVKTFNEMPFRVLGRSGLKVSDVGLGTWKMGYPESGDGSRTDEKTSLQILDRALELGVTFWDTANRYNNASGNSERIIGTWFNNNPDQRRNVVLATKLGGTMDGITPNHCGLSRTNIMDGVYASLERLQTDYLDVLYFHLFDPLTPPEESLMAVEDLIRQDLVRYFSVSNFTVEQIRLYQSLEKQVSSRCRLLAVQNQFDILDGESENHKGVLDYAESTGMSFIAWSPMARGLLTDKYLDPQNIGPGDRLFDEGGMESKATGPIFQKLQKLGVISRELNVELSQLVIAYMLSLPGMGPVIPSSSTVKQLESNAAAVKIALDAEQKRRIFEILI